jgi:hypothetical protein
MFRVMACKKETVWSPALFSIEIDEARCVRE